MFDIFELTGILGGIFGIFDVCFGFVIGSLSSYIFKKELKEDIIKAEKQYNELKIMIEQLRAEGRQQNISDNVNEENKESGHHISLPQEENKYEGFRQKYQTLRPRGNSELTPKVNDHKINESEFNVLKKFKLDLDWINITYTLKTLNTQVAYLLEKDDKYSEKLDLMFGKNPEVNQRNLNINNDRSVEEHSGVRINPSNKIKSLKLPQLANTPYFRSNANRANRNRVYQAPESQSIFELDNNHTP